MANNLASNPLSIDTDLASFQAAQTLTPGQNYGKQVSQLVLVAAAATAAGTVTITDPLSSIQLVAPIPVAASLAAGTVIATVTIPPSVWRDFAVTGVTATNTRVYVWEK